MINSVFDEFWKISYLSFNEKYGWSQDGRFFTRTCIASQIIMINSVFEEFWKKPISHLINSSWPSDAILWRQHIA